MDPIVRYLSNLIQKHNKDYGIVVWYDPGGCYEQVLSQLDLGKIRLFRFEGSFLQLRHKIEPFLERMEKPHLLIYIPLERRKTQYALIEAESAGCYLAPGHPCPELNTGLESLAQQVLKHLTPGERDQVVRKIQAGEYSLKDIQRLAESRYSPQTGSLSLVYDRSDPLELLIGFMCDPEKDSELHRKNARKEIAKLVEQQLGFVVKAEWEIAQVRDFLWCLVLINDFVLTAGLENSLPETVSPELLVSTSSARKSLLTLAKELRQRRSAQSFYQDEAIRIEKHYSLTQANLTPEQLKRCQTFPFIEKRLFAEVLKAFLSEPQKGLMQMATERRSTFWGTVSPYNVQWEWVECLLELHFFSQEIMEELKADHWTPDKLVERYTRSKRGWQDLDGLFSKMDLLYHALESQKTGLEELVEKAWVKGRQIYTRTSGELNRIFQEVYAKQPAKEQTFSRQREIFARHIAPYLEEGVRCACILVDALRYEMAVSLQNMLVENAGCQLQPVLAQLPTITPVGMAALLPGAESHLRLVVEKKRFVGVEINGKLLRTREERIRFLKEYLADIPFYETKLKKVLKPGKAVREAIENSRFVLITSQEIDQLGETLGPVTARKFMQEMLQDLRRAILELLKLGISRVVVTGDHGYLFGEEIDPGEKINPPGGETYLLHRRVWLGKGGQQHPAYLRLPESRVGLSGENELVFPAGIAAFKSRGGNEVYLHGGISLQEMVIPLMIITPTATAGAAPSRGGVEIQMERKQITNRFFTVQLTYRADDLFAGKKRRIKLLMEVEKSPVGRVVSAAYGYDSASGEVVLEKDKPNAITLVIDREPPPPAVDLKVVDAQTGSILSKLLNVPIKFLI